MLTKRQAALLDFLADQQARTPVSPSFDEMREHLGLANKSSIHKLVSALEERGFIRRRPHRARSIEILRTGRPDDCPHCFGTGLIQEAEA